MVRWVAEAPDLHELIEYIKSGANSPSIYSEFIDSMNEFN